VLPTEVPTIIIGTRDTVPRTYYLAEVGKEALSARLSAASSSRSLDARQARIDAGRLTPQENHIAADLEFFNRIGRKRTLGIGTRAAGA
jgi:hypothetical protein